MSTQSKRLARNLLDKLGFEIRVRGPGSSWAERATMAGCLEQAIRSGLHIETVLDVGAAYGTRDLITAFPGARHILVEPLLEFEPRLEELVSSMERAEYVLAAATDTAGQIALNVHPDLLGSSLYKEEEGTDVNGFERMVPAITLDDLCRKKETLGPYLIKIDAQGAELDVLRGAQSLLPEAAILIVEVSFFRFFHGGPRAYDCIAYLNERGFEIYDLFELHYRPLDGALAQVDIAFVPETSVLRQHHFYATPEQRHDLTSRIQKRL